jgi:hypothetical protein
MNMSADPRGSLNIPEPEYEVPIGPLQDALGVPLENDAIASLTVDFELCDRLYHTLFDYHSRNRIQPAAPDALRPNLTFVGLGNGVLVEKSCPPYPVGSYIPRNGSAEVPIDDIKRTLLFADAAVIEDPVFAFCRAVSCTVYHESRPPFHILEQALCNLADLLPLLSARLLRITAFLPDPVVDVRRSIPHLPGRGFETGEVVAATDYQDPHVLRIATAGHLPAGFDALNAPQRALIVRSLMRDIGNDFPWLYRQAEGLVYSAVDHGAYSPFLPNDYQYKIYRHLIQTNAEELNRILELDDLMELNSGCAVSPDAIGINELVAIRNDSEVFAEWRETTRQALTASRHMVDSNATHLDVFRHEMRQRERHWKDRFQKFHKGRVADVITVGKQISVSGFKTLLVTGAAAWTDPSQLLAFGTLCMGVYKSLKAVDNAVARRSAEGAALSLFAAVRDTPPH